MQDGSLNLTGEFGGIRSRGGYSKNMEERSVDLSGSFLNVRFDKTTNKPVFSRIPKLRAIRSFSVGESFRVFDYNNKVVIFYNDVPFNLKSNKTFPPKRSEIDYKYIPCALAVAVIDKNGSVKRELVKDLTDEKYLGVTSSLQEIGKGTYFIPFREIKMYGVPGNEFKWALISINNHLNE